jgi:VWFA-related protein
MASRGWWAAALLLGVGPAVTAQQVPEPAPSYKTGIEVVTVDVGVVNRQGQPVRGLGTGDFTVTVAGEPRRVVSAEFVEHASIQPLLTAGTEVVPISSNEGPALGRLIMFVVDQSTLESGSARQVARSASRFFERLTVADRSAVTLLPVGPNVGFTWHHARTREALGRVAGLANITNEWEYGSLSEARDIASRNPMALRNVEQRECRGSLFAGGGGGGGGGGGLSAPPSGSTSTGPGQSSGGGGGGGGEGGGSTGGGGTGTSSGGGGTSTAPRSSGGSGFGAFGSSACARDIQIQAESAWRAAQMLSLSSLTALRQVLSALEQVHGDKTVVLISGGWPMDEREQTSQLATVAADAAAARATLFTMFVPGSINPVTRRVVSSTPTNDYQIRSWPLDTLAGMTGGSSYRAEVGIEGVFERLGQELSGYYRIGIEKSPGDRDGRARRMRIQVAQRGLTIRAREMFDQRTYEDRDWTARMAAALVSPTPSTGVGIRMTSYLAADTGSPGQMRVVLTGEVSRLRPGKATYQVVVRELEGKETIYEEQPLGETTGINLPFTANLSLRPGSYIIRLAVMDAGGNVGSVDHRVEARPKALGALDASGPVLVRVPPRREAQPQLALDGVRQDERLALQMDLSGDEGRLAAADVVFEIAETVDGPTLVTADAQVSPGIRTAVAQGVADVRVLPPGDYVARAKVLAAGDLIGEVRRAFSVLESPRFVADATGTATAIVGRMAPPRIAARAVSTVPRFSLEQVLQPKVVSAFLDRLASRSDAGSADVRALLERARTEPLVSLDVPNKLASEHPIGMFVNGLSQLAQNKLEPAATSFRSAMRASPDFYVGMVYLGACYASGGQDKEAAGAWRTALIKEGDAQALYMLLTDALLRDGQSDLALQAIDRARTRWPGDETLKRRYAAASVVAGRYADGLQAIDEMVAARSDDEQMLALALVVLYEAFITGHPVETTEADRVRMTRLADAYRTRGGPSMALVDTWVAAANRKR